MASRRDLMTARIVPLRSLEEGESLVEGLPADRLALVARLSMALWIRTGHSLPIYTRATMPVVLATRQGQA